MKVLHTADWHIGQFKGPVEDGVNLRSLDTVKCLEYMVEKAKEEKPDLVCISGDVFHQEQIGPVRYSDEMVTANLRYYNNIKAQLRKEHPKMKQETIVRRARDKALKYAEKQHRYRAKTIALDELAEVYNQGAHFGIKQAQKKGYIGHVRKVWVTARQESVCKYCEAVEGVSKELDEPFDVGKCGMVQVPPAHPRCRCVLKYVEVREDKQ